MQLRNRQLEPPNFEKYQRKKSHYTDTPIIYNRNLLVVALLSAIALYFLIAS